MALFQLIAVDFDGTRASQGQVSPDACTPSIRFGAMVWSSSWSLAVSERNCTRSSPDRRPRRRGHARKGGGHNDRWAPAGAIGSDGHCARRRRARRRTGPLRRIGRRMTRPNVQCHRPRAVLRLGTAPSGIANYCRRTNDPRLLLLGRDPATVMKKVFETGPPQVVRRGPMAVVLGTNAS